MSGSAGLSAARRRRGVVPETKENSVPQVNKPPPRAPMSAGNLLMEHDKKVFAIESKLQIIEQKLLARSSLDTSQQSTIPARISDDITQKVVENKMEIRQYVAKTQGMAKQMQEMNSLIVTLKATMKQQVDDIANLKGELSKLSEQYKTLETSSQETKEVEETLEETPEETPEAEETTEAEETLQETKRGRSRKSKGILKLDVDANPNKDGVTLEITENA